MILSSESLPANVTRVRSLVGVRPLVYQQIVTFRKLSITKFAYKLLLRSRSTFLTAGRGCGGRGRRCRHRRRRCVRGILIDRIHDHARICRIDRGGRYGEIIQSIFVI